MENTIQKIEKEKIIVIARGVAKKKLIPLGIAMYNGGIRLIECTYDASGIVSDEEVADGIRMLVDHFDDAGTHRVEHGGHNGGNDTVLNVLRRDVKQFQDILDLHTGHFDPPGIGRFIQDQLHFAVYHFTTV